MGGQLRKHIKFQSLLNVKFESAEEHDVRQTAGKMSECSESSLYTYVNGTATFLVDLIPALFKATGDRQFLEFCLKGTGYTLAPLPGTELAQKESDHAVLETTAALGAYVAYYNEVQQHGAMSPQAKQALNEFIDAVHSSLEEDRKSFDASPTQLKAVPNPE